MVLTNQLDKDIDALPQLALLLSEHVDSLQRGITPWQSGITFSNELYSLHDSQYPSERIRLSGNALIDTQYLEGFSTRNIASTVMKQVDSALRRCQELDRSAPLLGPRNFNKISRSITSEQQSLAATAAMSAVYLALGWSECWKINKICHRQLTQILAPGLALEIYGASTICELSVLNTQRIVAIGKLGFELVRLRYKNDTQVLNAFLNETHRQLSAAKHRCLVFSQDLEYAKPDDNTASKLIKSDFQRYKLFRKVVRQYQAQSDVYVNRSKHI